MVEIVSRFAGPLSDIVELFAKLFGWVDKIVGPLSSIADKMIKIGTSGLAKIASAFGLPESSSSLSGHATGGQISGPGTGTSDSIVARLSDGEFIVNAAATAQHLPLLHAINDGHLPGFADGGLAGQRATDWARSHNGEPYVYGALDCSGYMSGIYDQLTGKTIRFVTDSNFSQFGFVPGLDLNGFSIGSDGGSGENGHMAGTLFGTNVESDGTRGIQYGGTAHGAANFPLVWHLPGTQWNPPVSNQTTPGTATPAAPNNPADYSPTGTYVGPSTVDTTKDLQQAQQKELPKQYSVPGILSKAGEILGEGILGFFGLQGSILDSNNVYNKGVSTAVNYYATQQQQNAAAAQAAASTPGSAATPSTTVPAVAPPAQQKHVYARSGGAEQWRGTVVTVLQGTGRNANLADRTVAQIGIESGGNPTAVNDYDINAQNGTPSIGLLQVIKPTFDSNADPRFPGTQQDPEANIAAALNYVDHRYGGPANIWPTTAGYADGGWINGPGNSTSDSVPIWASTGEFIVNAGAAAANGDWLKSINAGASRLAPVPAGFRNRSGGNTSAPRDHSINFHGDTYVMDPQDLVDAVDRHQSRQAIGLMAAMG
jgi:hypothetical protein